jgi:dTDP-4-dehydrorhamnose reductase
VLRVESLFGRPAEGSTARGSLALILDRIKQGSEVPVFVDRTVSPSHTDDVARAAARLVDRGAPYGLYNCVNTGHATWAEIAEHVAAVLGKPLNARPLTLPSMRLPARRPRFCALANAKLTRAAGEMPRWQDAIATYLKAL